MQIRQNSVIIVELYVKQNYSKSFQTRKGKLLSFSTSSGVNILSHIFKYYQLQCEKENDPKLKLQYAVTRPPARRSGEYAGRWILQWSLLLAQNFQIS